MSGEVTLFDNAEVVTADDRFRGWVAVADGRIVEVGHGRAPEHGHDLGGDFLLPGLIEIHTDHLEAHFMPRPEVAWHRLSAVLSYDAQIAASGITTVFDSLRMGTDGYEARPTTDFGTEMASFADTIAAMQAEGHLRADHLTHLRCEVPAPDVVTALEAFVAVRTVNLISLMDHTPGQRQFRDLDKYFTYYGGKSGKSHAEVMAVVAARQRVGAERAAVNRPAVVAVAHRLGIPLASHDDTTRDEVERAAGEGVRLAEFPTTRESAEASRGHGMATIMGGPNVVRGGSHSGNVAARDLADAGLLDILSSDYVPASLLLGAFQLAGRPAVGGLPGALRLVTKNPAEATGLHDRGEIAPAKRADLVRVAVTADTPIVREVWRLGRRVA